MTENADTERVYRINDALSALAAEFDSRSKFETDDDFDAALNEATHQVADLLRMRLIDGDTDAG